MTDRKSAEMFIQIIVVSDSSYLKAGYGTRALLRHLGKMRRNRRKKVTEGGGTGTQERGTASQI